MQRLDLLRGSDCTLDTVMNKVLHKKLRGFTLRPDNSLFLVYEGCLIELIPQAYSQSVDIAVTVPDQEGLFAKSVADLSFDKSDVNQIVHVVGKMMQKARSGYYGNK